MTTNYGTYFLGHAPVEIQRLIEQADYQRGLTKDFLSRAGLTRGMRVLDLGCGPGDVSLVAAELVGPTGRVTGVDQSAEVVRVGEGRAAAAGLTNCQFAIAQLADWVEHSHHPLQGERFDAVIGRMVLMYLPRPSALLQCVARMLRPGGIVAFQEIFIEPFSCKPRCELAQWCAERIRDAFVYAGRDLTFGLELPRLFREAGLPAPDTRVEARVELGAQADGWAQLTHAMRAFLPAIVASGSARREDVDIETLEQRLRTEAACISPVLIGPALVGAWARTPGAQLS